jgi:multidrug efflux pump subunit AcrB
VFVPMFFLQGVAGFLFVPMAEAVMFAMIASFILSRTLVPTMAMYLLKAHHGGHAEYLMESHGGAAAKGSRNPLVRFQHAFEARFARVREGYRGVLALALTHRPRFLVGFMVVVAASFLLMPMLGSNFFPSIDSGAMILHVRAPVGTRLEDTAAEFDRVEQAIRGIVPPNELSTVVDNIGLPVSGINRAYSNTGGIGPQDGDIYITLAEHHRPTAQFMAEMRRTLPQRFPGSVFSFLPADIISQILNFGAPAPIDVQVAGPDRAQNEAYAGELLQKLRAIPGLADVRLQQSTHYPQLNVAVDRSEADRLGVTERDVTNTMVTSLAGSFQTSPAFWLNPRNGVSYPIVIQSPQQDVNSFSKLENMPLGSNRAGDRQILGGVATAIRGVLKATARDAPKGATVSLRGQVSTMDSAFTGLGLGLLGAIVLIYLLIVVNFQSWADPFVIVSALPAALAGIVWMLFITGTPLSVPALTGAIMCMGVATANSILVVSFARERLAATGDGLVAALEAGFTRFRPVLMTALAMIIGMAPMALGLGEGGEQNAPLGRAVIGGLIFATCASLLFVPVVFSLVHRKAPAPAQSPAPDRGADPGEAYAV